MPKKRTVSPRSVYNTTMNRWETEYLGDEGFANAASDWTNDQLNILLQSFLVRDLPFVGTYRRASLLVENKRTLGAVKVALWKLAGRYTERRHFADYTFDPTLRSDRENEPWTTREMALIALATNESGISRGAHFPDWIGKIIGRSSHHVLTMYNKTADRHIRFRKPENLEQIAKLVHESMKPFLRQLEGMIRDAIKKALNDGNK